MTLDKEKKLCQRQIGSWRVIRLLGAGGMADVFEVEHVRHGRHAALKYFTCNKDSDGQIRARFLAEAALLARLNHPRLVRVYDYGIDETTTCPYFVMDLILDSTGTPLTLADKRFAGVDEDRVAMWYEDMREALAFIHAQGVVHRDIKLQNVLVGPDGHVVLSDFGIAKIFDSALREKLGIVSETTILSIAEGRRTVMGSLGYLAPELEMGVAASPASDYYALGVLVFYLLTGMWCEQRTSLAAELETYSPVWMDILPKLLHANPAARECPSWRMLEQKFRESEAARSETTLERALSDLRNARNSKRIAQFAALVLGIGAVLAFCLPRNNPAAIEVSDICSIPDTVPHDDERTARDYDGPTVEDLEEDAIFRARGLICDTVARVNRGEISYATAADLIRGLEKLEEDDAVMFLLAHAASNLLERVRK